MVGVIEHLYHPFPASIIVPLAFWLASIAPVEILTIDGITALKEQTSTPSITAGYAKIYSKEISGSAEMFVLDEANNETQISPHNPAGEWEYKTPNNPQRGVTIK